MARLSSVLALARLSDRRWSSTMRSGGERSVEALFGAGCAFAIWHQLKLVVYGRTTERFAAERLLLLCVCVAWIIVPLSVRPSIPLSSLASYPLSSRQRVSYLIASYLQKPRMLAVFGVSLLTVVAELWLPLPVRHISQAIVSFLLSATVGLGFGMAAERIQKRGHSAPNRGKPTSRPFPFVRKELAYFSRTLDPYLALLLSVVAGYSEYLGVWLTPLRLLLPLLLIALIQSSAILNPFALDSALERERYQLLPVSYRHIVVQKHAALAVVLASTTAPLVAALFYRMPVSQLLPSLLMIALVFISWFDAGLLLMQTQSAQRVRMAFGSLSGEGMSLALALFCGVLVCTVPVLTAVVMVRFPHEEVPALSAALALLTLLYAARLRSLRD
jgi:hypothetical protein